VWVVDFPTGVASGEESTSTDGSVSKQLS